MRTASICVMVLSVGSGVLAQTGIQGQPKPDVYPGWHLAVQAWSFNRFTLYEAIERTSALGIGWIEAYPGQKLSAQTGDAKFDPSLTPELREQVKQKLKACGVRLVNYGVENMPGDEAGCRKIFDFAKDMGVDTIQAEPAESSLERLDKLCQEYKIGIGIHNHPKQSGSHYWNPEILLAACKGRTNWIGACADTGHWVRSGLDPIASLKKLEGRIRSVHFKDLGKAGDPNAEDVVWGTGVNKAAEALAELNRQAFAGVFAIEYEANWDDNRPQIAGCVAFFNKTAAELYAAGFKPLLKADLSNANLKKAGSWRMVNDVLERVGGESLWTKQKYGDFVLDLDFKVAKDTNSGVFIRCGDLADWINTTIEIQIHETTDGARHGQCGAVYDIMSPSKTVTRPTGEWNSLRIAAKGPWLQVVMNGEKIVDINLDNWTEAGKNPQGTPNKFKYAYKDMPRSGFIGFQDHDHPVWFRNIRIREL
jgi:sugar phosphate isomerase/epimerase